MAVAAIGGATGGTTTGEGAVSNANVALSAWEYAQQANTLLQDYEAGNKDAEVSVRRLLEFCQLDWRPECMDFYKSNRIVNTASYQQVREPLYTRSVGRWRHYAAYLTPLVDELGDLVPEADQALIRAAAEKAGKAGDGLSQAAAG